MMVRFFTRNKWPITLVFCFIKCVCVRVIWYKIYCVFVCVRVHSLYLVQNDSYVEIEIFSLNEIGYCKIGSI